MWLLLLWLLSPIALLGVGAWWLWRTFNND